MVKKRKWGLKSDVLTKIKTTYDKEFDFITDLFAKISIPSQDESDLEDELPNKIRRTHEEDISQKPAKTTRAKTLEDLHERIKNLQVRRDNYRGKMAKKRLKSKIRRKKKMLDKKQNQNKSPNSNNHAEKNITWNINQQQIADRGKGFSKKTGAPLINRMDESPFNKDGNLVVSKLELLGETSTVNDRKILKSDRNVKQALKKIEKREHFIKNLEQVGDKESATIIRQQTAWKNALRKAEGLKVKDDPMVLKKTLRKKMSKKKASQKKWQTRLKTVEQEKATRQKKRTENLAKRKEDKRKKKLKKVVKKGRHIPKKA